MATHLSWREIERDYARTFFETGRGHYYGMFHSFDEARAAIPDEKKVGFDHPEPAQLYRDRMQKACQSDYGVLFWLQQILDASSYVFDFGGHVGVSYHGWHRYLNYPRGLRWKVYDLPAITKVGKQIAQTLPSEGLSFTETGRRLGLHESTVRYRLQKVLSALGAKVEGLR